VTGHDRHAGDRLAALVDGRLEQPEQERVLAHLIRCARCRADYEAQLMLKGMLGHLDQLGAPSQLQARLARLPVDPPPEPEPVGRGHRLSGPARVAAYGVAAGSAAVLTLGTGYMVGGGNAGQPVVPAVDRYATDHAAVTSDIPLIQPQLSQLTAVRTPFLPGVSTAVVQTRSTP
jgi:anti-sigma factor RsiW